MRTILMILAVCAVTWGQTATPVVTLTSPVKNEEWVVGSTHEIQWTGQWTNLMIGYTVRCWNTPWIEGQSKFIIIEDTVGSFPSGSYNQTWTVPDSLDTGLVAMGIQMWDRYNSGLDRDTIRIIGRPHFTSDTVDSVNGGESYSARYAYTLPGNPSRHSETVLSKPLWLTVDTAKDSIYGNSPARNDTDTVKVEVKAYTKAVFQSRTQNPQNGHWDTTWTAIDSIADTLNLVVYVNYLITNVIEKAQKYALSVRKTSGYVYDVRGRKTLLSASGIYFNKISGIKRVQVRN